MITVVKNTEHHQQPAPQPQRPQLEPQQTKQPQAQPPQPHQPQPEANTNGLSLSILWFCFTKKTLFCSCVRTILREKDLKGQRRVAGYRSCRSRFDQGWIGWRSRRYWPQHSFNPNWNIRLYRLYIYVCLHSYAYATLVRWCTWYVRIICVLNRPQLGNSTKSVTLNGHINTSNLVTSHQS